LPHLIADACSFIFAAANYSASAYAMLSAGAAHLLGLFGTQDLVDSHLPKILSGQWQGTMAMTEPEAGSSRKPLRPYCRLRGASLGSFQSYI